MSTPGPNSQFVSKPLLVRYQPKHALTTTQEQIASDYFSFYLETPIQKFIETVPAELHALRAFLINCSFTLPTEKYQRLLEEFFPPVTETSDTLEQNQYFRKVLLDFNQLAQSRIDINHPLYSYIFDPRVSPTKSNSPTKKNIVTNYFRIKVQALITPFIKNHDKYVESAKTWLIEQATLEASSLKKPCAQRALFT